MEASPAKKINESEGVDPAFIGLDGNCIVDIGYRPVNFWHHVPRQSKVVSLS